MRRLIGIFTFTCVMATGLVVVSPQRAEAWKPPTHLFGTETALMDALDGTVTVPKNDGSSPLNVPVNATIRQALQLHPDAYRAGTIGPDAFPDTLFGQGQIHPDTKTKNDTAPPASRDVAQTFEWLQYLWEQAWNPAQPDNARLRNIAFALGFMGGHAAGDVWAHTWVNDRAEGVFPDVSDVEHAEVAVRHVIVEGYADKHRPGYEQHTTYPIDAPTEFIADTLILSQFSKDKSASPMFDFFFDLQDGLSSQHTDFATDNTTQDILFCIFSWLCFPDPTDSPLNVVEWSFELLIEDYLEHWIDDITEGLRAWPEVWEAVAREMYTGKKPDSAVVLDAIREWALLHLLSMFGVPDFVGQAVYFVGKVVSYVLDLLNAVLHSIWNGMKALPVIGDLVMFVEGLYNKATTYVMGVAEDLTNKVAGVFLTLALGFTDLDPDLTAAIDKEGPDGIITPREVIRVFQEPEEYLGDTRLFPSGTRAAIDADMGLTGCTDDDAADIFCDYDPVAFAPLYDTTIMAKLAMLDGAGLNQFFRTRAGGNTAALGDLYGPHTNLSGTWTVPANVMTGWAKSIDAEYQWRTHSPNDGHSYGTGAMWLWEDCVSREKVFRTTFKNPVQAVDGFTDTGDPPTGITDSTVPSSDLSVTGPQMVIGGTTYVRANTELRVVATDNYYEKQDLRVFYRAFPQDATPPPFGPGEPADSAPFNLVGSDGPYLVDFHSKDGHGLCNAEGGKVQRFVLDNQGPVVTVHSPAGAAYASDGVVPLLFTASDAGVGIDPATARQTVDGRAVVLVDPALPSPGGAIDLFDYPAGEHHYTAQQEDLLGNEGSATVTWSTVVTHGSLQRNLTGAFTSRQCVSAAGYRDWYPLLLDAEEADGRGDDARSDELLEAFKLEVALRSDPGTPTGADATPYCADVLVRNATALQQA